MKSGDIVNETLRRVNGRWALVSKSNPKKVLQYYHGGDQRPSAEWVNSVERRVHSFGEGLTEAFDRPYPYEWDKDDFGNHHAFALLGDGSPLNIKFEPSGKEGNGWHVVFNRNFKYLITGQGYQQQVFATVLAAVKQFVEKYKPGFIEFSANKDVGTGQKAQSRANLYNSLVNRYAGAWGYRAHIDDQEDEVVYKLTRINQPVSEGSRESKVAAMEKKLQDMQNRLELTRERRKMRGQRIQSTAEINLAAKMSELRQQIHQLKSNVTESASISTHGTTTGGYTWRFEAGREIPFKTDVAANTFIRVKDPDGKTVAGVWADVAGDSLEVEYSQVFDEKLRGRGLYTDLLKSLSNHYAVTSDTDTNNAAVGIYRRLGADYDTGQARHTLRKKGVAEGSNNESLNHLVSEFLKSISPKELRYYTIRDNCGPAALHMKDWAEGKEIDLTRHQGYFVADNVVYDKADFTKEMKREFIKQGLDFNDPTARKQFIESNPKYSEEWKKIPHYWLQDKQGNIYDPTGHIQFVKTGLSSDLDKSRYKPIRQGVAEGSEQSLASMASQEQSERNEFEEFVKSQAGGDWTKGAKMYAQLKKRPSNDIFGDASRQNQFMKMKFDFDKFTDVDWHNYWLMAQHCDHNRDFQKNALLMIKKYLGTDHKNYKYLYDRISCGATGNQKYGTQRICDKDKQGVAEGYSNFTFQTERRRLNVPALIKAGALFVTYPHGEQGWEIDKKEDWAYSLISLYNVESGGWTAEAKKYIKPASYKHAEQSINSSKPNLGSNDLVYDGKYNQIIWSIEKLKLPDNVAFLDKGKQGVAEGKLNFEEGDCPIFAIALHRLSKMPLMALVEYDEQMGSTVLVHAYVKLDDRWRLDASGETDVDWMLQKYPNNGNAEEIEISEKDLLELGYGKSKCPTLQQVLPHAKEVLQNIEEGQQGVAEGKVKLYTDPSYFGAEVDDTGFDNLPIVNISANQLVGFEPDAKMNQLKSKANVEKIVAGLKQGAKLPPLLVRKYKNGYQVLDGHHRFWAYKLLGVKSIPSRIVPDEDIEEISKQGVAEAVTPSQNLQSSILYHGTPTKAGYQGISSQGLKVDPELIAQKYKGQENFAPLPGVYMTKEFGNAVRYSFMSNVPDEQYANYIKQEPNGYVFEFSGKDLTTVTPDEDELGSLLRQLINTKNLQPNLLKIVQAVPEELRVKLQQPNVDFETIAIAGKWLVNKISDSTIQYLMKRYHNVVNYGGIKPSAVWVIPKPNERFLRDRQGTFNTYNGYVNYAKRFGKKYDLTEEKKSIAEGAEQPDLMSAFRDFLPIAMRELDIDKLPPIRLLKQVPAGDQPTFGEFVNKKNVVYLGISERHPVDILRTLAHELVHYKQNTKHQLAAGSGETGSPEENQAHEVAGVIMRDFNRLHPEYFDSSAVELTEDRSDYEIRNRAKLDNILVNLCRHVVEGQRVDPKKYGMVAACVVDPDNRQVIGVNELTADGTRRHGERVAIERYQSQYGDIPEGSIIVTTCSPCNEEHMTERYGESCTDIINNSNCRKVYCGYQDPSQTEEHNEFTMEVTGNADIVGLCKHFAATFLNENFADGRGPGRPGDSVRHGIPKNATMAELERASHAKGRKGQLARWQLNMRRGRKK